MTGFGAAERGLIYLALDDRWEWLAWVALAGSTFLILAIAAATMRDAARWLTDRIAAR